MVAPHIDAHRGLPADAQRYLGAANGLFRRRHDALAMTKS
nr:MAG TPA: hypothetical protein [Caudoviricetes sp.]